MNHVAFVATTSEYQIKNLLTLADLKDAIKENGVCDNPWIPPVLQAANLVRQAAFGQKRTVKATADPKLRCQLKHAVIGYIRRDYYLEFIVSAYIPALIWVLSGVACHLFAKRRLLKRTALRDITVALTGPFSIPWVLVAKPEKV